MRNAANVLFGAGLVGWAGVGGHGVEILGTLAVHCVGAVSGILIGHLFVHAIGQWQIDFQGQSARDQSVELYWPLYGAATFGCWLVVRGHSVVRLVGLCRLSADLCGCD